MIEIKNRKSKGSAKHEAEEIKEILKNGGFLSSGFITLESGEKIEKWNLSFYNPGTDKITSVTVSKDSVKMGVTDKPLHKKVYNPDESKIKIDSQEALERARKEFEKYKKPLAKILISFQKKEQSWEPKSP